MKYVPDLTLLDSWSDCKLQKPWITTAFLISGRGDMIRTCDILLPKQALYQTELRPETMGYYIKFF